MTLFERVEAWLLCPESQDTESAAKLLEECARKLAPKDRKPRGTGLRGVVEYVTRYPGCTHEEVAAALNRHKANVKADLKQLTAQGVLRFDIPHSARPRLNESTRRYFPMEEQ